MVLHGVLGESPWFLEVLPGDGRLSLPGWYLAAGCVAQTVRSALSSRPPDLGIRDYGLSYFDPGDLSWDAEDTAIHAANEAFAGLPAAVKIRNGARAHLWYVVGWTHVSGGCHSPPHRSDQR